jgi:hypothetical protein
VPYRLNFRNYSAKKSLTGYFEIFLDYPLTFIGAQ